MRRKSIMKKCLAAILSFAMTVTLFPANPLGTVEAADGPEPVLHWDMSHADGKLKDISGNNLDGKLVGLDNSDFVTMDDGVSQELMFEGEDKNKYVEIPAGALKKAGLETFTIEATYTVTKQSAAWLFTLGTTVNSYPNVKNYLFVAPWVPDGDYKGKMLAAIKDGSTEMRCDKDTALAGDNGGGKNIVSVVFNGGNVTYYLNGKKSKTTETTYKIQDILNANSTATCIGYIGKSLYNPDPAYKGSVLDFKIYDQALTETQVGAIHKEKTDVWAVDKKLKAVRDGLLKTMLGDNKSVDEVDSDLNFPAEVDGVSLTWKSSNTAAVTAEGKVNATAEAKKAVIIVKGEYQGKSFEDSYELTVITKDGAEYDAFMAYEIPGADNIKGNITLPVKGKEGSEIVWTSNKENVISPVAQGDKPAGVVNRQSADTNVKLTATLKQEGGDKKKEYNVTVKAKANVGTMTDYVFAYFAGDGEGEQIFLAASRDGLNWEELNNGEPVLKSEMGTKGLRDPYILRSPEGDKFYLVATDLSIAATNWDWSGVQTNGSQAVMVWESDDLVHWTNQRMCVVSAQIEAGCTWAPEIFYDDATGEYMLFWASKVKADNYAKQRIYYCKTRDFYTFTEPQIWIDNTWGTIDTTVIKGDDNKYYRFSKNEDGGAKYIYEEVADSLLGEWKGVGWTNDPSKGNVGGGEGPCVFKVNEDDVLSVDGAYCLLIDDFGGVRYYPQVTDDLASADFRDAKDRADLPTKPCHGTVMNITEAEYNSLMAAYGLKISEDSLPSYVPVGYTLPAKVKVDVAGQLQETDVTWDKTDDEFATAGKTVKVTGTVTVNGMTATITKEITVISNTVYFIDSGVGSWNDKRKTSQQHSLLKQYTDLRNVVPDQLYTAESGWGFVNDSGNTIAGTHTNAKDDIYSNGWYAKSGQKCEYVIPLENGKYKVTGYFQEWWGNQNRTMDFYAEYTDGAGQKQTSEKVQTKNLGSTQNVTQTQAFEFEVKGVTGQAEVHFYAVKSGNANDPVISGLMIDRLDEESEELKAAKEAAKEALTAATLEASANKTALKVKETAQVTVTGITDDLRDKAKAAYLDVTVSYKSGNTKVATVDAAGKVTAVAAGTANITPVVAIGSKIKRELTPIEVTVTAEPQVMPTGISFKEGAAIEMLKGSESKLTPVITPENASNPRVTWKSSDPEIVAVISGKITAVSEGKATITATSVADKTLKTECEVTVKKILPTQVSLNKTVLDLRVSATATLTAQLNPANTTESELTWESSDESIATVESTSATRARVRAVKSGEVTITVKTQAEGVTATCKVFVNPVTEISIPKTASLKVNGTQKLTVTYTPADGSGQVITWSSSNEKVATVDASGTVKGISAGNAVITAQTANGVKAECTVTVTNASSQTVVKVSSIKISAVNKNIMAGKKTTVKPVVNPSNATNKAVTFKSSNTKYATVNNKGVVTTKKAGAGKKVTITATANDGSNKVSNKLTIKILKYGVKKVSFKKKTLTVKAGKKVTLKPTITPTNKKAKKSQINKTLSYKSSNTKWATVNSKGKVTTKKAGKGKTVKITATSTDGTNKKATVKIKIKK